jgi:hypothetical protein
MQLVEMIFVEVGEKSRRPDGMFRDVKIMDSHVPVGSNRGRGRV